MFPDLSETLSLSLAGRETELVRVEVGIRKGLPLFQILGLASQVTKESRDRIRIALETSGFYFPFDTIVINLNPHHRNKKISFFDLPIALGILSASKQHRIDLPPDTIALGSLSLSGRLSGPPELLHLLWNYHKKESSTFLIPTELKNAHLPAANYVFLDHLRELNEEPIQIIEFKPPPPAEIDENPIWEEALLTPNQMKAFLAICYGILGGHHTLLIGNPGTGKTMLARMASQIQPYWLPADFLSAHRLNQTSGDITISQIKPRPFRSPHHTTTELALVGGGSRLALGEVSLADGGILFLDELSEFKEKAIEALREPMEERKIQHARVLGRETFPADAMIIAATNPCPCGHFMGIKNCNCSKKQIRDYLRKISGPFLDRISIVCFLFSDEENRSVHITANSFKNQMNSAKIFREKRLLDETRTLANGNTKNKAFLDQDLRNFSFRQKKNLMCLARSIADWELSLAVNENHILEAYEFINNSIIFERIK